MSNVNQCSSANTHPENMEIALFEQDVNPIEYGEFFCDNSSYLWS